MTRRLRSVSMFALLALSVILAGGIVEGGPVQGQAWVIYSATPSPAVAKDTAQPALAIGRVDTAVTLDMVIATFEGMAGGDKAVTTIREGQAAAARGGKGYDDLVLTPLKSLQFTASGIWGTLALYNADLPYQTLNLEAMWKLDAAFFLESGWSGPVWPDMPGDGMTPPDPQPQHPGVARISVVVNLPPHCWFVLCPQMANLDYFWTYAPSTWQLLTASPSFGTPVGTPMTSPGGPDPWILPLLIQTAGAHGDPFSSYSFYFDKVAGSAVFWNFSVLFVSDL